MKTKIETASTYWIGLTDTQLDDLRAFLRGLQARDVAEICKRMSVAEKREERIQETLGALSHSICNELKK